MIAALALLALTLSGPPNVAANGCSKWHSESHPPTTIRVRLDFHRVVRVPFRLWVARVTSSEWNSVPDELRKAGAVAVKGYGWWKTMHPRSSKAGCFDVWDSTRDAIYRVKSPPDHVWEAVNATWTWRVVRDGRLVHTGWRTGRGVGCARDVDGYHLFARSAIRCARLGYSASWLLRTYYNGRLVR